MNQLQVFKNSQLGEIRVVQSESGEPLFCLADLCKALDLRPSKVAQRIGDDVLSKYPISDSLGREQLTNFVNEDGLYDVILDSRKPEAKHFRKWVTSEVLPSIRKNGAYLTGSAIEKALSDPDSIIQFLTSLKEERAQREMLERQTELQSQVIKKAAPKVEYFDGVMNSVTLIPTTIIAKELGMSAKTLNRILHKQGVQHKVNGTWVLYEKDQDKGYTGNKTHKFMDYWGNERTAVRMYWTEKGRFFVHGVLKRLLKKSCPD